MKAFPSLMIAVVCAVMTGCSSPTEVASSDTIVGTWVWVESIRDWPVPGRYSPESEGYTFMVRFTADSKYSETRNDSTVFVTTYTVEEIDGRPAQFRLAQNSIYPFTISNDTLLIDATDRDGPREYFVRQ